MTAEQHPADPYEDPHGAHPQSGDAATWGASKNAPGKRPAATSCNGSQRALSPGASVVLHMLRGNTTVSPKWGWGSHVHPATGSGHFFDAIFRCVNTKTAMD